MFAQLTVQFVLFVSTLIFLQLLYKSAKKQGKSFGKATISQEMDFFAKLLGVGGFFAGVIWLCWEAPNDFAYVFSTLGIGCIVIFGAKFGHSRQLASWFLVGGSIGHGLALLALIWHLIFGSLG